MWTIRVSEAWLYRSLYTGGLSAKQPRETAAIQRSGPVARSHEYRPFRGASITACVDPRMPALPWHHRLADVVQIAGSWTGSQPMDVFGVVRIREVEACSSGQPVGLDHVRAGASAEQCAPLGSEHAAPPSGPSRSGLLDRCAPAPVRRPLAGRGPIWPMSPSWAPAAARTRRCGQRWRHWGPGWRLS